MKSKLVCIIDEFDDLDDNYWSNQSSKWHWKPRQDNSERERREKMATLCHFNSPRTMITIRLDPSAMDFNGPKASWLWSAKKIAMKIVRKRVVPPEPQTRTNQA